MKAFWRTPVYVLFGATLIILIASGSRQGFGLFLRPLSADLGWGVAEFSLAIAVQNLVMGMAAPFIAAIGDRWGPIRVIAASGALYAIGVALISVSTTPETMLVSAGLIVGLGAAGVGFTLPLALVGRVASDKNRAIWLGIVTGGGSAGQFVFAWINNGLVTGLGWQTGILVLGVIVALTIPLGLSLAAGSAETLAQKHTQSLGQALSEASTHRGYWLLVIGFFVCGFQVQFAGTHLPNYLQQSGADSWLGAKALATIGLFNLFGTIIAGWLGGRYRKAWLLSLLYIARALLFLVFMHLPVTETTVLGFSAILGLLWLSTVPLTSGIVAQIFGPRYMATLFAIVFLSHQLGSFCGVYLPARIFDATGGYGDAWWLAVALGVAAALIHWPINERPLARPAGQSA